MLNTILADVEKFREQIAKLKTLAPTYPQVYVEQIGRVIWVTSMVSFIHNNQEFKRHHVESGILNDHTTTQDIYQRLIKSAEQCIKYAVPVLEYDEPVSKQD